jgi:hypothetical protein
MRAFHRKVGPFGMELGGRDATARHQARTPVPPGHRVFTQIRRRHGHDGAPKGIRGKRGPYYQDITDWGFWLKCVPLYGRKVVNEYCKCRRSA